MNSSLKVLFVALLVLLGLLVISSDAGRGNACVINSDCVSWVCVYGTCVPRVQLNGLCDENADCISNTCNAAHRCA